MKKYILPLSSILITTSLVGVGYAVWDFSNDNTVDGNGEVSNVELNSTVGEITFTNLSESSSTIDNIELLFEADRVYFLNDNQVNYTISSESLVTDFSSYYINFSLNINISGENANLIGNALHIDDFSYENHSNSTEYAVRFVGSWGTPVSVSEITSYPYDYSWKFSELTLGYASKSSFTNRSQFKAFKTAVDTCSLSYVFNVTLDTYQIF